MQTKNKPNLVFDKLPQAQQRVEIAKDVLEQLRKGRVRATSGTWLENDNLNALITKNDKTELQSVFKKLKSCDACALGAIFLCTVEKANKLTCGEIDVDAKEWDDWLPSMQKYLKRFFSKNQLALIETAFEQGGGYYYNDYEHNNNTLIARDFAQGIEEPEDRMRLIMENIIVNNGTFRPNKKPVQMIITPGYNG